MAHAEAGDCPLGKYAPPPSRGLGDTVAKITNALGIDKVVHTLEKATGRDCGCKARREKLNQIFEFRSEGK